MPSLDDKQKIIVFGCYLKSILSVVVAVTGTLLVILKGVYAYYSGLSTFYWVSDLYAIRSATNVVNKIAQWVHVTSNDYGISLVLAYVVVFVLHVVLSLIITIAIASLTLVERRVLSLVQRRVGPNHVGFRGRLQFIADALKLLLKGITVPDLTNRKLFIFIPAVSLFICYTFWINTVWGPSVSLAELEYNLVYASIMSCFFSICIILTGIFSRNKYAIMAAVRCCCMVLNLEILLGFLILVITGATESFSFSAAVNTQGASFFLLSLTAPILPVVMITFLLETNRAPFDLTEAESELVAGYTTELGGFFFALFYLGEYFHLFLFSLTISLTLLGGWL